MEECHRAALRQNWIFLMDNLLVGEVLDRLVEDEIFTVDMYEETAIKQTTKDKITHFLFLLQRRGPQAFGRFVVALRNTNQNFIADKLTGGLNQVQQMES